MLYAIFTFVLIGIMFTGVECTAQSELSQRWRDNFYTELSATHNVINLTPTLRIYEDNTGQQKLNTIQTINQRGEFRAIGGEAFNPGYRNSAVWLTFSLGNHSNDRWLLEFDNPNLWVLRLFVEQPDSSYREIHLGIHLPFSERLWEHRHFLVPLHNLVPPGKEVRFYARIVSGEPIRLAPKVWKVEAFIAEDTVRNLIMGLYYGILLLIIAYNLILFVLSLFTKIIW